MNVEAELKIQFEKIAKQIDFPVERLPYFVKSFTPGSGHEGNYIKVDLSGEITCAYSERGVYDVELLTTNIDEVLYWFFQSIIFSRACDYERKNRIPNQDSRRILFAKEEELIRQINPLWEVKLKSYHADVLTRNPFTDYI